MGCILVAFFKIDNGIIYGGKSTSEPGSDGVDVKTVAGWELLGIQIASCLIIILWSGGLSAIFFAISKSMGVLRLTEQDEILGGDLHYFGPIEFYGNPKDYDLVEIM
jgi:ammonia channel protein AmtB